MVFAFGLAIFVLINAFVLTAARSAGARLAGARTADALLGAFTVFFAQVVSFGVILGFTGRIDLWWYLGAAIVLSGIISFLAKVKGGPTQELLKPAFEGIPKRLLPVCFFLP